MLLEGIDWRRPERTWKPTSSLFSYGTRTTTTDQLQDATIQSGQARSIVGSTGGNLNLSAGTAINVAGSDLGAVDDMN